MFSQAFKDFMFLLIHLPITLFALIYNFGYTDQQRAMIARNENQRRQDLIMERENLNRQNLNRQTNMRNQEDENSRNSEPKFKFKEYTFTNVSDGEDTNDSDW